MARRLTTNQEIAGSIPASLKMIEYIFLAFSSYAKSFFGLAQYYHNFLRPATTALIADLA
jgi:hypothetical protein